jgi:aryl-alcohol dehydrogenase-like predicted oxidoreductase
MANLIPGHTFVDGEQVTAASLNAAVAEADIGKDALLGLASAGALTLAEQTANFIPIVRDEAGCWHGINGRPEYVRSSCEASLMRLGTDYIDLYQVHAPDPETPIAETLEALTDLVRAGKVRYIGCSNFAAWQIMQALWTSEQRHLSSFVSLQPRYNMLFRMIEDEILPVARTYGLGVIPYNPLAGGMLTGRYVTQRALTPGTRFQLNGAGELYRKRYWNDVVHEMVANLHAYFDARGIALTHAALAWVRSQPGITSPIVGASRPEQLADSLANLALALDDEAMQKCNDVWFELPRERDISVARR